MAALHSLTCDIIVLLVLVVLQFIHISLAECHNNFEMTSIEHNALLTDSNEDWKVVASARPMDLAFADKLFQAEGTAFLTI